MSTQPMKRWRVNLGVRAPKPLVPLVVRDKSGYELRAMPPGQERTAAVQEGVNVVFKTTLAASRPDKILEQFDPILERVLNVLSFRLLQTVQPIALEIVEDRPESESREVLFLPEYSPIGLGRFKWVGFSSQGALTPEVDINHGDTTDVAIHWFLRGMQAGNPVDSFAGYWLSIETLAGPGPERPLTMRCCGHELSTCPSCGQSTVGPTAMRNRLRHMFTRELGKDEAYFENLWDLRNFVFHGSSHTFRRMLDIAGKAHELKALSVQRIKAAMGIPPEDPPVQAGQGTVLARLGLGMTYLPEEA